MATNIRLVDPTSDDILRFAGQSIADETKYPWKYIDCANYTGIWGKTPGVQECIHKAFMSKLELSGDGLVELWEDLWLIDDGTRTISNAPMCHGVYKQCDIADYIASVTKTLDAVTKWGFRPIVDKLYVLYARNRLYAHPIIFYSLNECQQAISQYRNTSDNWNDVADHSHEYVLGSITNIRTIAP